MVLQYMNSVANVCESHTQCGEAGEPKPLQYLNFIENPGGVKWSELPGREQTKAYLGAIFPESDYTQDRPEYLMAAVSNGAVPIRISPFGETASKPIWKTGKDNKLELDKDGRGRIKTGREIDDYYSVIEKESNSQGAFILPGIADGGWEERNILTRKVVVFEFDKYSKPEQWGIIETLCNLGLVPRVVVDSGGKSLHVYFYITDGNAKLCAALSKLSVPFGADGDSIKARQVYRLPGFRRGDKWQTLEFVSDASYTADQFVALMESVYQSMGLEWTGFDPEPKKTATPEGEIHRRSAVNINPDDALEVAKLALESLPESRNGDSKIEGTIPRDQWNSAFWGVQNTIGTDLAIELFSAHSPQRNWGQTAKWGKSEATLGSIIKLAKDWGKGFELPERLKPNDDDWLEKYQALVIEDQKKLNNLTYEPDILIDSGYFPPLDKLQQIKPLPESGILTLVGSKGSGKSTLIEQVIKHYQSLGYKVVSLTPRVALGRAQAFNWGLKWLGDLSEDGINLDMLTRHTENIGACFESLKRFEDRDFAEKHLIILDESELGLSGVVTSSTHKERAKDLKILDNMLSEVLANGGVVLLSDADETDVSVDYIKSFGDNVPVFTVKNNAKPKQWEIDFYTGGLTSHDVEKELFEALESDKNYIYCTDSKAQAIAVERDFLARFPGEVCININGDTTQEDSIKEIVKNINLAILKNKPKLLIYNGSLGVGSSIDGKVKNDDGSTTFYQEVYDHFDAVYGAFFHEQPSQCRQILARYRKPVKRVIWAKESGYKDQSCRSYRPSVIKRNLFKDKEASLSIIDMAREIAGDDADDMTMLTTLNGMMKDGEWDNPHIDLYCNVKARKNYAVSQLSALLLTELTEEGHNINVYADGGANAVSDSIKERKTEIKWEESEAIANAPDLDQDELKRLQKKRTQTKEERAQISKALINQELPGIDLTTKFVFDWVVSDRRKKLNALKLFFYAQNPEVAKQLDSKEWRYRLKQFGEGCPYLPDIKTFSTKVKAINDIGLFDLIDMDNTSREYRAGDDDVQAFFKRCYLHRYRLNRALGVTVTKQSEPVALLGRIAKKVGLGFTKKRYRDGDNLAWVYRLDPEILRCPDRANILKILGKKHAETTEPQEFPVFQNFSGDCITLQERSRTKTEPILGGGGDSTKLTPGSIVELTFNGDRHLVNAVNGQTVVSKPIGGGETALTHIDWVKLAG
jgi:hypothetical protein